MNAPAIDRSVRAWPEQLRGDGIVPRLVVDVPGRLHERYEPVMLSGFAKLFSVHAEAIEAMQHAGATITALLVIHGHEHVAFTVRYERHRGGLRWRCTQRFDGACAPSPRASR